MNGNNSKDSDVFDNYLHNEATKRAYRIQFNKFLTWYGHSQEELLKLSQKDLEKQVIEYIAVCKDQGLKPRSIYLAVTALKFVTSMNDVLLNWDKLKRLVPKPGKLTGSDTWEDQDIREMIKVAGNSRNRALIYFLKSTGVRKGAIPLIKLKHIKDMDNNCKSVLVYDEDIEEYTVFMDPESSQSFESYLDRRTRDGEELSPDSWAFCTNNKHHEQLNEKSIDGILTRIIKNIPGKSRKLQSQNRYNIQLLHGFRKWYSTKIKLNKSISHSVAERLQGHKAKLDENYFRPHSDVLFQEWLKIMPDLLLDDHKRKDEMIKQLSIDKDKQIEHLQKQLDILWNAMSLMDKDRP